MAYTLALAGIIGLMLEAGHSYDVGKETSIETDGGLIGWLLTIGDCLSEGNDTFDYFIINLALGGIHPSLSRLRFMIQASLASVF